MPKKETLQSERSSLQQTTLKGRMNLLAKRLNRHKVFCETWQCVLAPRMTGEHETLLCVLCFSLCKDGKNCHVLHLVLQFGHSGDQDCSNSNEPKTWSIIHIVPCTAKIKDKNPCPSVEAICISGCNLAPNLELN